MTNSSLIFIKNEININSIKKFNKKNVRFLKYILHIFFLYSEYFNIRFALDNKNGILLNEISSN